MQRLALRLWRRVVLLEDWHSSTIPLRLVHWRFQRLHSEENTCEEKNPYSRPWPLAQSSQCLQESHLRGTYPILTPFRQFTFPEYGTKSKSARRRVVFPLPLGPTMESTVALSTLKLISSRIVFPFKLTHRFETSRKLEGDKATESDSPILFCYINLTCELDFAPEFIDSNSLLIWYNNARGRYLVNESAKCVLQANNAHVGSIRTISSLHRFLGPRHS